jgi:tight adherence protein B
MNARALLVGACLILAAVVVAWPGGTRRSRQRRLLRGRGNARTTSLAGIVARWAWATQLPAVGLGAALSRWPTRRTTSGAAVASGLVAALFGGPVAGVVAAAYGAMAVQAALRRHRDGARRQRRRQTQDALCSLAADLRAGVPPTAAWEQVAAAAGGPAAAAAAAQRGAAGPPYGSAVPSLPALPVLAAASSVAVDPVAAPVAVGPAAAPVADARIARLAAAAWQLAERTGAPLADLIERVEADARATDRARAAAAAQAAGARATAWLLGALPAGGIALGYAIGADPLRILLHTSLGAVCALTALGLQLAGLAWAERLATAPRVP